MSHVIYCKKLKKEADGLDFPPYPGELGNKIYLNISAEAWKLWLQRQTMFINEYRLNLSDIKSRKMLEQEMEKFLFEENSTPPDNYVPEEE